jgi:hypothetical protein
MPLRLIALCGIRRIASPPLLLSGRGGFARGNLAHMHPQSREYR